MKCKIQKYPVTLFLLLVLCHSPLFGQDIITAPRFLEMVSENYATIRDFEANIVIRSGAQEMIGTVNYKAPNLLRIDFTRPANQAIVFNGETLVVFIPDQRTILSQNINRRVGGAGATSQGLTMLVRNFVAAYETGPNPVLLDGTSERVIRLRLTRRSAAEGFREIILSIDPETRLIRRMEGRTMADSEVRFDFTNIRINQGIPEQRFIYDPPAGAAVFHNFLFRDTN